jgi:hypothetical protein
VSPEGELAALSEEHAMLEAELLEVRRVLATDRLNVTMGTMLVRMAQLRDQAVIERDEPAMIAAAWIIREHLRAWHARAEHIKALAS